MPRAAVRFHLEIVTRWSSLFSAAVLAAVCRGQPGSTAVVHWHRQPGLAGLAAGTDHTLAWGPIGGFSLDGGCMQNPCALRRNPLSFKMGANIF